MVSISKLRSIQKVVQKSLMYLGYFIGTILLLESLSKIVNKQDTSTVIILTNAALLWFFSFATRHIVFSSTNKLRGFGSFIGTEVLYFVLCFAFVSIFLTTLVKYLPFGIPYEQELSSSSELLNYVVKDLAFYFIVHFILISGLVLFVSLFSKYIYISIMGKTGSFSGDTGRMKVTKVLTFSFIFVLFLSVFTTITQITFVSNLSTWSQNALGMFLQEHFQWLIDYTFGLPSIYYIYASVKGTGIAGRLVPEGSTLG